jgi:hypothetical protein
VQTYAERVAIPNEDKILPARKEVVPKESTRLKEAKTTFT